MLMVFVLGLLKHYVNFVNSEIYYRAALNLHRKICGNNVHILFLLNCTNRNFLVKQKKDYLRANARAFVSGVVKDAFSLWLNQHVALGEALANLRLAMRKNA